MESSISGKQIKEFFQKYLRFVDPKGVDFEKLEKEGTLDMINNQDGFGFLNEKMLAIIIISKKGQQEALYF